jgi:hypothetical protein
MATPNPDRTPEEQEIIDLVARDHGKEWAEAHAQLILDQARSLGKLPEKELGCQKVGLDYIGLDLKPEYGGAELWLFSLTIFLAGIVPTIVAFCLGYYRPRNKLRSPAA